MFTTRILGLSAMTSLTCTRPIVFCGPSGSGKSTLVKKAMEDFPNIFGFSVSHTTRKPRIGEIHGQHYHFTSKSEMQTAIEAGNFLESATFSENIYGTSKAAVEEVTKSGKVCILDIDIQGVKQILETDLNPWLIFVEPPSLEVLKQRLIARKTESEDSLKKRLQIAEDELNYGKTSVKFDLTIVNNNLDEAYDKLRRFLVDNILKEEKH